ncbi:hypothetical protein Pgy4_40405, partial [Pseudomonas savastanoi pv. glycinea str. race 4]
EAVLRKPLKARMAAMKVNGFMGNPFSVDSRANAPRWHA